MNKIKTFILLWIFGTTSITGQNMVVLSNRLEYVKKNLVDVHYSDTLRLDSLPSIEVNNTYDSQNMSIDYRKNMRYMRDSLKQVMRIARDNIYMNIRGVRDSVRNDLHDIIRKHPHQLRIGWGDQLFETLAWYDQPHSTLYPESYIGQYEERYRYAQHWFAEYQYRIRYWFNVGGMIDYSGVVWDKVNRNGLGKEVSREKNCNFHNIAIMATARFTYMHTKYVSLHSGLGVGLNINTGSEIDYRGRKTALAPALNLTVLGMSVGNEKWFGAVEFGGLYSLMNIHEVYLAGSRMFTLSVGCRF